VRINQSLSHKSLSKPHLLVHHTIFIKMADVSALKSMSIDKYISEPTSTSDPDTKAVDLVWPENRDYKSNQSGDSEVDIYGYGDAAPTPQKPSVSNQMPRRSSLKPNIPVSRRASIGYTGEMVSTLPSGKKVKRRTSVSFHQPDNVIDIKPLTNLVDDPNQLWFDQKELHHIKQDVLALLKELKEKKIDDDEARSLLCSRGLEPLLFGESGSRLESTESVLEEYAVQRRRGEYNDDHIREMYRFHTIESQVEATERAQGDAREIEPDLKLSRRQFRRSSC
jgi:hypothetical protein